MNDEIVLKEGVILTLAGPDKQNLTLHDTPPLKHAKGGQYSVKYGRFTGHLDVGERVEVLDVVEISNRDINGQGCFWVKVKSLLDPPRVGWMQYRVPQSAVPEGYRVRPVRTVTIVIEKITE